MVSGRRRPHASYAPVSGAVSGPHLCLLMPYSTTRLTVVPRLAVRLALRNQVARGRGRSSHVVFAFAESLDVGRDFTRSQRRSAVN